MVRRAAAKGTGDKQRWPQAAMAERPRRFFRIFLRTPDYYVRSITCVVEREIERRGMGNRKPQQLGRLQLAILKVLWERGPGSVTEVKKGLGRGSRLAYTTVATVLRRMEADGLVAHETDGRRFIYRAAVPTEQVVGSMADDLVDRVFEGSLADMVSHLLSRREVDAEELKRLERLIAERKKRP